MTIDRTAGQLAGIFMQTGAVTCRSPEEYDVFCRWVADKEIPVDVQVDERSGDVSFSAAQAVAVRADRSLPELVTLFNTLGSVVMTQEEHRAFDVWARSNNVPLHRQVDRALGRVVVMRRGWGSVEGA